MLRCSVRASALLRVCRLTAHNGTMQCLCCVCGCFRGRAARRVQEGLSLLRYSFVRSFQVVSCEQ